MILGSFVSVDLAPYLQHIIIISSNSERESVQLQLLDYNEVPYRQAAITSEIVKECPSSEIGFSAPRVPWSDIQSDLVNAACGRARISSILSRTALK